MSRVITALVALLLFSNSAWGFVDVKEEYYKGLEGDGEASDFVCNWFDLYTDGQIFDDNGKQLDTSLSKIDQFCLHAAEKGFHLAQVIVGSKYAGMQSKRNKAEAIKWFIKAANQGNKEAYSWLGEMYAVHDNVERDYSKALYWYTKAAESENANAQCQLGFLYARGLGTLKDNQQAKFWIKKGYESAKFDLTKKTCKKYWDIFKLGD